MTISRVCSRTGKIGWIVLTVAACSTLPPPVSGTRALPTYSGVLTSPTPATSMPTPAAGHMTATAAVTSSFSDSEAVWAERAIGADKVTVTFYSDPDGSKCLRYTLGAHVQSACADTPRATLVAVQGAEADSSGTVYSIIAGRALVDRITAVSIEFADGDNTPTEVNDGGFLITLPGRRVAIRAVPIDQYGNLVGDKFTFNH